MREIKFRFRLKELTKKGYREWFEFCTLEDLIGGGGIVGTTAEIIARDLFTDLKDKNGKEIYEGDLIKWFKEFDFVCSPLVGKEPNTIIEALFQVIFEDGAFWLDEINSDDPDKRNNRLVRNSCDNMFGSVEVPVCEIIGNVYENPELLKEK